MSLNKYKKDSMKTKASNIKKAASSVAGSRNKHIVV
jgi:hypothetical protein